MAGNGLSLGVSVEDMVGDNSGGSHLVSDLSAPLNHVGYRVFVDRIARFSDSIHNREVTLQCIKGSNGVLRSG